MVCKTYCTEVGIIRLFLWDKILSYWCSEAKTDKHRAGIRENSLDLFKNRLEKHVRDGLSV